MNLLALVTDEPSLPIDYDMPLLLDACREIGLSAEVCRWDDDAVDWSRYGVVVLRSPWTYVERPAEFLDWCAHVARVTRLLNPLRVVRWGLDKRYLADLASYGVPVVPSTFVGPGADPATALRAFLAEHPRAEALVVKPTVGAYSKDVRRFGRPDDTAAVRHIGSLLAQDRHVLLQPYVESIDRDGETDLIYIDGRYSHAIRKSPLLDADGTVNEPTQDVRRARDASPDERSVASAVLSAAAAHLGLDGPMFCGRIDLIRDGNGRPIVLEAEVCEPSLSLPFTDGGAMRLARAMSGRLAAPETMRPVPIASPSSAAPVPGRSGEPRPGTRPGSPRRS